MSKYGLITYIYILTFKIDSVLIFLVGGLIQTIKACKITDDYTLIHMNYACDNCKFKYQ